MWIKKFLEGIQNSDERVKRRWMILFSIAAIMVIVAFWIFFTVPRGPSIASNTIAADEPGFWQIFKNGASVVFNSVAENLKNIFSRITEKKTIVIE